MFFRHKQKHLNSTIEIIDRDGSIIEVLQESTHTAKSANSTDSVGSADSAEDTDYSRKSLIWWVKRWKEEKKSGNQEHAEMVKNIIISKILLALIGAAKVICWMVLGPIILVLCLGVLGIGLAAIAALVAVYIVLVIISIPGILWRSWRETAEKSGPEAERQRATQKDAH